MASAEVASPSPSHFSTESNAGDSYNATHLSPATSSQPRKSVTSESSGDEDVLPIAEVINTAARLDVQDVNKVSIPFGSLYAPEATKKRRHLFVFVRHFFCGLCQDYVRDLTRQIPPSSLPADTQLSIIGCGSPELIPLYRSRTECSEDFPIYADNSRRLYEIFGMMRNLNLGDRKPDYQTRSTINMAVESALHLLANATKIYQGGSYSQLGGEILFEDGEVVWCHRMRNTRDHTEVAVLREMLER